MHSWLNPLRVPCNPPKALLPAGGHAIPMSYAVGAKQYVVIAAGGHGGLGPRTGDYLMANALP